MKFAFVGDESYFNASSFIKTNGQSDDSVEGFYQENKRAIKRLNNYYNITDSTIMMSQEGDLYVQSHLALLFLAYVEPEVWPYYMDRISDLFEKGFTTSDNYVYHEYRRRSGD